MSTEIGLVGDLKLTRFYCCERGYCLQLTPDNAVGYVQLDARQIGRLRRLLASWKTAKGNGL